MGVAEILRGEEDITITNPLTGDSILSIPNPIGTAKDMYDKVTGWMNNMTELFQGLFGKVGEWLSSAVSAVTSLPTKLINGVTGAVGGVAATTGAGFADMVSNAFNAITSGLSTVFHFFWDNLSRLWRKNDE